MNWLNPEYSPLYYSLIIAFSFFLVFLVIPSIIHVAKQHLLFDNPEVARKSHDYGIARLGGIAVFASLIICTLLFSNFSNTQINNYIITSYILLFSVGLKDDLWGVNPSTKFFIQLLVSLIIVFLADIRLTSFHGVFGIYELPYFSSVFLSILVIIFITNAFNLIDGIDGLVGITSVIVSLSFAILFVYMNHIQYACMAFTMFGASLGFLWFNVTPAKIFMGDAGSMLLGLMAAIMSIEFIELNTLSTMKNVGFVSAPAIAMGILIGPLFDAIRVFVLRILKKGSPFIADNNHIHHRFLRLGFSHMQTTFALMCFNISIILLVLYYKDMGNDLLIALLFCICILFNVMLTVFISIFERRAVSIQNS
ncbi:MraY family glycosyltransferase [Daejeonella oryzae]|uniref:MraY family glycosyltransferase n=1 Tax=Daejeonella oryzae TaxID=1122943 RepID=UPI00040FE55E|nr:MraY family glycosyltransferase [Daejeonella oryzae]